MFISREHKFISCEHKILNLEKFFVGVVKETCRYSKRNLVGIIK